MTQALEFETVVCQIQPEIYGCAARTADMVDITVFKLDVDDQTFNAPFANRLRSDRSQTADANDSGRSIKRTVGLGALIILAVGMILFGLKRKIGRLRSDTSTESEQCEEREDPVELSVPSEYEEESLDTDETDTDGGSNGLRSIIGLSFLIVSTAIIKRVLWIRR